MFQTYMSKFIRDLYTAISLMPLNHSSLSPGKALSHWPLVSDLIRLKSWIIWKTWFFPGSISERCTLKPRHCEICLSTLRRARPFLRQAPLDGAGDSLSTNISAPLPPHPPFFPLSFSISTFLCFTYVPFFIFFYIFYIALGWASISGFHLVPY